MTLKQKREIVQLFKANRLNLGHICNICGWLQNEAGYKNAESVLIVILRDYMNGKFKLAKEPSGKKA